MAAAVAELVAGLGFIIGRDDQHTDRATGAFRPRLELDGTDNWVALDRAVPPI